VTKRVHVHNASVTGQVADSVELGGQAYGIAGARGGSLFDPGEHRIKPCMIGTACWRGHICWYRVEDSSLHLVRLNRKSDLSRARGSTRRSAAEPGSGRMSQAAS
jgi:hypothetical protein